MDHFQALDDLHEAINELSAKQKYGRQTTERTYGGFFFTFLIQYTQDVPIEDLKVNIAKVDKAVNGIVLHHTEEECTLYEKLEQLKNIINK